MADVEKTGCLYVGEGVTLKGTSMFQILLLFLERSKAILLQNKFSLRAAALFAENCLRKWLIYAEKWLSI